MSNIVELKVFTSNLFKKRLCRKNYTNAKKIAEASMVTLSKSMNICAVEAEEANLDIDPCVSVNVDNRTVSVCASNVPVFSFDVDCFICGMKLKMKDRKSNMKKVPRKIINQKTVVDCFSEKNCGSLVQRH